MDESNEIIRVFMSLRRAANFFLDRNQILLRRNCGTGKHGRVRGVSFILCSLGEISEKKESFFFSFRGRRLSDVAL